jgi:hypothetical protein
MKKIFFLFALSILLVSSNCKASNRDSLKKTACIVHFRIDCKNPGIKKEVLLKPLYNQLKRIFKIDSIINLQESTVLWSNIFRLKDEGELLPDDLEKVNSIIPDLIISIKVEHWLGSMMMVKGKKHVLLFTCTIFDRTGKRVWEVKKKDSCCRVFEFGSAEFNESDYPIDKDTFLKLYQSVIKEAFGSF